MAKRGTGARDTGPVAVRSPCVGNVSIGGYRTLDQTYEAYFAFD